MIRIGGKSQCEALQKLNLSKIRSGQKSKRDVPTYVHHGRHENHTELTRIQQQITQHESDIEHLCDTVLGDELREVILRCNPQHYYQLMQLAGGDLKEGILDWLGTGVSAQLPGIGINNNNNYYGFSHGAFYDQYDEEEIKRMERERVIDMSSDEEDDNEINNRQHSHAPMASAHDVGFRLFAANRNLVMLHFKREIRRCEMMSPEYAAAVGDMNALLPNRWNLYKLWIHLYALQIDAKIKELRRAYEDERLKFNLLRNREDIEIVKRAKIIGMTTTGAAKYRHIIDGAKPKITSERI